MNSGLKASSPARDDKLSVALGMPMEMINQVGVDKIAVLDAIAGQFL